MAADCGIAEVEVALVAVKPLAVRWRASLRDYWTLTKPEINLLIAIATFAGFYMACPSRLHAFPLARLLATLAGTLLVAGGAGTLNQYVERRFDRQMRRTARRPLADGRLDASSVLCFGILLSFSGIIYLLVEVNALTSALAALTLAIYLGLYTPLKRRTPLCTIVGALPGAMPPLIGWAAASGTLSFEAWVLYTIVFLWQFPHFMAIAWMYRDDYPRAGYRVLPRGEHGGSFMSGQAVAASLALIPAGLIPAAIGAAGFVYSVGAGVLSCVLYWYSLRLGVRRSNTAARQLLMASIVYLPLMFLLMVLDKR